VYVMHGGGGGHGVARSWHATPLLWHACWATGMRPGFW